MGWNASTLMATRTSTSTVQLFSLMSVAVKVVTTILIDFHTRAMQDALLLSTKVTVEAVTGQHCHA